jgi:toxin ParE1/3/4
LSRAIIFRPDALRDLIEIWDYSELNWGNAQADDYVREIHAIVGKLADNPALGSPQEHVRTGLRKITAASHAIYYFHDDNIVRVSRILHGSMDARAVL